MRTTLSSLIVMSALLAACGGGGGPAATPAPPGATNPPGQATVAPGAATPVPQPVGGAVVTATLTGPDAGTYTGSGDPACSHGFLGADVWGVVYGNESSGAGQLGGVNIVAQAPAGSARAFTVSVTIGPMLGGTLHTILFDPSSGGAASIDITDSGSTAIIHATGPTIDGAGTVDVTVNCPSVIRV